MKREAASARAPRSRGFSTGDSGLRQVGQASACLPSILFPGRTLNPDRLKPVLLGVVKPALLK